VRERATTIVGAWLFESISRSYAWEHFGLCSFEQGTRFPMEYFDCSMVIVDSYVQDKTVSFTAVREDMVVEMLDWRIG